MPHTHTWLNLDRDPAKLKQSQSENTPKRNTSKCTTGASKISWTCRRSSSRLVLDLAVNVEQNLDCVMFIFLLKSHLRIETLLPTLQYHGPIPSSHFRRNANFRGRAVNMGSISPDSAGAKRSRLKVGPQLLRFRVCDSLLVLAWQVSFWSASHQRAACKQKYRYSPNNRVGDRCFSIKNASDSGSPLVEHYWIRSDHVLCTWDKNEKDDFGDGDKRNPTKLCLASASLHQHRSPAAVLPWLWRKQQIRDKGKRETGHVVWQTSYYWGFPDVMKEQCWLLCPGRLEPVLSVAKRLDIDFLHGAKHFGGYSNLRTNFIYFQLAGVIFQQTMFHFRRLHVSMIKIILSFIKSGHPSNHPTKPRWVRHRLWALCRLLHSWAGQSRSAAPSQTCAIKGMLPWKRDGVPKGWPKIISERPKAKCEAKNDELMICPLTSPNSITF